MTTAGAEAAAAVAAAASVAPGLSVFAKAVNYCHSEGKKEGLVFSVGMYNNASSISLLLLLPAPR